MINNKRIAKNTILLYMRMLVFMVIGFYSSRVILNTLGVVDYGINNVVGGIVTMFTFINGALSTATSRHLTFAIGEGSNENLKKIFGASLSIHLLLAILIIILAETIGLWLFFNKMNIPIERQTAAMWVYQLSVMSTASGIMSIPFNAIIIAHEKMSAFAWITIFDAIMKLLIIFLLLYIPFDKLIIYSILFFIITIIDQFIYMIYCRHNFIESKTNFIWDRTQILKLSSFAGWSLYGNLSVACLTQGENILLNMFFGPIVNAARGIAIQTQAIIQKFTDNFQMALNPQITKTFACNDIEAMHKLIFRSSRFSFCVLLLLSLPIMLEANYILTIWLKIVPTNTILFFRIIMCISLLYASSNPMIKAIQATGYIKRYELLCGTINLSLLPIAYILLTLGYPAYSVLLIHFILDIITQIIRLLLLRNMINLSIRKCITNIYLPIFYVIITSILVPIFIHTQMSESFLRFITVGFTSLATVLTATYFWGLQQNERFYIKQNICHFIVKYFQ